LHKKFEKKATIVKHPLYIPTKNNNLRKNKTKMSTRNLRRCLEEKWDKVPAQRREWAVRGADPRRSWRRGKERS
jgi:hypothetical protein